MNKEFLQAIDDWLYEFLLKTKPIMPTRIAKWIALYYTDARVRKAYSDIIGVKMGEGTYANIGLSVIPLGKGEHVNIGKNVSIGPNATFIADSGANNSPELNKMPYVRDKLTKYAPIVVDDEVWIGANVTILPGAGSVVTKDVMPYTIIAGVPAREIQRLTKE